MAKRKTTTVKISYPAGMSSKMARTIVAAGTNYWIAKIAPETKLIRIIKRK